ncbi:hypothetical protein BKA66DRAFT_592980 [Pyrenochaeta sp. MPI-SDFR-AT-0127]|nr:hypothetical protein BKA66DRAFT_592980 [Pyrenochaeta sp. MPI-SDFR-AT-0127]
MVIGSYDRTFHSRVANSTIACFKSQRRDSRLEQLHQSERERRTEQHVAIVTDVGSADMALNTNWMRRTGWGKIIADGNRKLLVVLAQLLYGAGKGLFLGKHGNTNLFSRREDEKRVMVIVAALDRAFDRCEDTVKHTDTSIRCWLRGQYLDRPYKAPFELVGHKSRTEDESDDASISTDESDTPSRNRLYVSDRDSRGDLSESHDGESKDGSAYMDTNPTEPPCTISSHFNTADNSKTSKDSSADSVLEDLVLRLGHFLVTEKYEDGQPCSTPLVYFSSVLGISADGSTFERAAYYTPKLSGMIYCARLIFLESTLARFAHHYIGWKARLRRGQLDHLNKVRREKMCLGSQAPMGELLSLRTYGRACSRSDGPSFRVNWSDDGQVVSWDKFQLSMAQFPQISQSTLDRAAMVCKG